MDQEDTLPLPPSAAPPPSDSSHGDDLGLPSHLWAALEQRWGSGGGPAEDSGGDVLLSVDDEMDRHPCMVPLVLMLERACQMEDGLVGTQPPEWAASLLRVLQGGEPAVSRYAGCGK